LEPWQLQQLQRLVKSDPERVEAILNTLWNVYPGLYTELAVSAVDQEILSVRECAERLDVNENQVERDLTDFRLSTKLMDAIVVRDGLRCIACLAEGGIPVWEVIREYRKLGSAARLKESFPSLSEGELAAAMRYASAHPDEIESLISDYENVLARRRAEYPFAK